MPFHSIHLTYLFLIEPQGAKHTAKALIAAVNFLTFPPGLHTLFCGRISQNNGENWCLAVLGAAAAFPLPLPTCFMLCKHLVAPGAVNLLWLCQDSSCNLCFVNSLELFDWQQ